MSIFNSSTPVLSGQKVPCEVGKTVVNSPEVNPLDYITPNQLLIISHALGLEGEERNIFYLSPNVLMVELADLVQSGYMKFTWTMDNGVECYEVTDMGKALVRPRPQQVQLAQARAGSVEEALEEYAAAHPYNGQKVPCDVGNSPVFSPQYVVYRRMLDETILYMTPFTRGVTHDIDKARKYPSKGSAQQACRAFGGSCHVLELRPQPVQLAQANAGKTACRQCHVGKRAKGLEICHACANGAIKAIYTQSDIPAEEDTPTFEGWVPTAEETAGALAALAPHLSPDRVAVASDGQSVRGARKIPPVVTGDAAQDADYVRVRAAREAGCNRPCGNQPDLPVCTKCHVNAHKGKYNPAFHGYQNWLEVFEGMSVVHGWIKPSGVSHGA